MSDIKSSVQSLLTDKFEVPEAEIAPEATLGSLGLDSLALAELALTLKQEIGVDIEEQEANKDTSVSQLVETLLAKKATA